MINLNLIASISKAEVDLALIQTSLLFLCKSCYCNAKEFLFTKEKQ